MSAYFLNSGALGIRIHQGLHQSSQQSEYIFNQPDNFLLDVLTDLQNRGLKDILIACVDGLPGCHLDSLPANQSTTVYRPHGPQLTEVCALERLQGGDG